MHRDGAAVDMALSGLVFEPDRQSAGEVMLVAEPADIAADLASLPATASPSA